MQRLITNGWCIAALPPAMLMLTACQRDEREPVATTVSQTQSVPRAMIRTRGADTRPTINEAEITPRTSQPLGIFATEADAVAAARAAGLRPGIYGLAMVDDAALAITGDGTVFLRAMGGDTVPIAPSGPAQRPPR